MAPSDDGFSLVGLLSLFLIEAGARAGDCLFLCYLHGGGRTVHPSSCCFIFFMCSSCRLDRLSVIGGDQTKFSGGPHVISHRENELGYTYEYVHSHPRDMELLAGIGNESCLRLKILNLVGVPASPL